MPTHDLPRTLTWQGRTIAWDRFGDGPPLVLLHGTPWSQYLWRPYAEALASRFTVHLWDMPGYGHSSKDPAHAVDLGFQSEVFGHLLRDWGLERPHVIAHDYGGTVALRARLLHGVQYASLCLIDVVALRPWGSPFYRLVREHADVLQQLPPAVHRGAVEAYIRTASHKGLTDTDLEALVEPWTGELGQPALYRQIEQADERFTDEVEERYGDIDEPVHIIWGTEDAWIPVDHALRLHAGMPGSSLALIDDAGHLIQLDAPVRLATELTRWTESVR
ncbi:MULTISPECIES: alpha/beta fold hydrolase [Glycomyces]|uniref:Alpha/beta hydrolase n=2 Tax=Glycomyces TaxID=58113 RepID=A0A9X3PKW1_9ACTN|nr:alpha/beta hydrolase [Glycomyces lechevalierae]MDA1387279.1 alpha/beta hydrolase [Glycomyces lechevalierae]MDR7338457.1 pimeloyl-ACP methyl ester carboxylesterase [Glycomyces lechevalierae]